MKLFTVAVGEEGTTFPVHVAYRKDCPMLVLTVGDRTLEVFVGAYQGHPTIFVVERYHDADLMIRVDPAPTKGGPLVVGVELGDQAIEVAEAHAMTYDMPERLKAWHIARSTGA